MVVQTALPVQTLKPVLNTAHNMNKWHPEKLEELKDCLQEYAPR